MVDYAALVHEVHEADAALAASGDASGSGTARLRTAYDALLTEFPLCYGYVERCADFERVTGGSEGIAHADAAYERALTLGRNCVELWAFYGAHAAAHWANPTDVRALFERGASLVGSDYASDTFWDRYLAFETSKAGDDYSRVASLYRRQLQLPLRSLDALWLRFQQLAVERTCAELLNEADEVALQAELEEAGLAPARPPSAKTEDDGARKLRLLPLLEAQFKRAKSAHAERLRWEGGIKRRHFHLQPPHPSQLAHWHAYLDWEEARADVPALVLTFERCLLPCASDEVLWLRYVRSLEGLGMVSEAREAFGRASRHHLRWRCSFVLEHAAFEEAHHDAAAARRACAAAAALRPAHLAAFLAQANLERRLGDLKRMRDAYAAAVSALDGDALAYVVRHAAHYAAHMLRDERRWPIELIEMALRREPASEALWDVCISHEIMTMDVERVTPPPSAGHANGAAEASGVPKEGVALAVARSRATPAALARVYALFRRAVDTDSALADDAKQRLLQRHVQVARDYSDDVASIRELSERLGGADTLKRRRIAS